MGPGKPTNCLGATNQQQIPGQKSTANRGICCWFVGPENPVDLWFPNQELQINSKFRGPKSTANPGICCWFVGPEKPSNCLGAPNQQQIPGPKSTANPGICCWFVGPEFAVDLWFPNQELQINSKFRGPKSTANPGICCWFLGPEKPSNCLGAPNQQQIPGPKSTANPGICCWFVGPEFAVDLWFPNPELQINSKFRGPKSTANPGILLICGPGEPLKLPGSSKSTANSGPEINSKSRDLLLICGPGICCWFVVS